MYPFELIFEFRVPMPTMTLVPAHIPSLSVISQYVNAFSLSGLLPRIAFVSKQLVQ
jgi:hypothetical protein